MNLILFQKYFGHPSGGQRRWNNVFNLLRGKKITCLPGPLSIQGIFFKDKSKIYTFSGKQTLSYFIILRITKELRSERIKVILERKFDVKIWQVWGSIQIFIL